MQALLAWARLLRSQTPTWPWAGSGAMTSMTSGIHPTLGCFLGSQAFAVCRVPARPVLRSLTAHASSGPTHPPPTPGNSNHQPTSTPSHPSPGPQPAHGTSPASHDHAATAHTAHTAHPTVRTTPAFLPRQRSRRHMRITMPQRPFLSQPTLNHPHPSGSSPSTATPRLWPTHSQPQIVPNQPPTNPAALSPTIAPITPITPTSPTPLTNLPPTPTATTSSPISALRPAPSRACRHVSHSTLSDTSTLSPSSTPLTNAPAKRGQVTKTIPTTSTGRSKRATGKNRTQTSVKEKNPPAVDHTIPSPAQVKQWVPYRQLPQLLPGFQLPPALLALPGMSGGPPAHADDLLNAVQQLSCQPAAFNDVASALQVLLAVTSNVASKGKGGEELLVLCLDTETAACSPSHPMFPFRPVDVCVIDHTTGHKFSTLVNHCVKGDGRTPDQWQIEPGALETHSISYEMVKNAPSVSVTCLSLMLWIWQRCEFQGGARVVFVAHNSSFDVKVLLHALIDAHMTLPVGWSTCDTLQMSKILSGQNRQNKLSDCAQRLGIAIPPNLHRAEADVRLLQQVLDAWMEREWPKYTLKQAIANNFWFDSKKTPACKQEGVDNARCTRLLKYWPGEPVIHHKITRTRHNIDNARLWTNLLVNGKHDTQHQWPQITVQTRAGTKSEPGTRARIPPAVVEAEQPQRDAGVSSTPKRSQDLNVWQRSRPGTKLLDIQHQPAAPTPPTPTAAADDYTFQFFEDMIEKLATQGPAAFLTPAPAPTQGGLPASSQPPPTRMLRTSPSSNSQPAPAPPIAPASDLTPPVSVRSTPAAATHLTPPVSARSTPTAAANNQSSLNATMSVTDSAQMSTNAPEIDSTTDTVSYIVELSRARISANPSTTPTAPAHPPSSSSLLQSSASESAQSDAADDPSASKLTTPPVVARKRKPKIARMAEDSSPSSSVTQSLTMSTLSTSDASPAPDTDPAAPPLPLEAQTPASPSPKRTRTKRKVSGASNSDDIGTPETHSSLSDPIASIQSILPSLSAAAATSHTSTQASIHEGNSAATDRKLKRSVLAALALPSLQAALPTQPLDVTSDVQVDISMTEGGGLDTDAVSVMSTSMTKTTKTRNKRVSDAQGVDETQASVQLWSTMVQPLDQKPLDKHFTDIQALNLRMAGIQSLLDLLMWYPRTYRVYSHVINPSLETQKVALRVRISSVGSPFQINPSLSMMKIMLEVVGSGPHTVVEVVQFKAGFGKFGLMALAGQRSELVKESKWLLLGTLTSSPSGWTCKDSVFVSMRDPGAWVRQLLGVEDKQQQQLQQAQQVSPSPSLGLLPVYRASTPIAAKDYLGADSKQKGLMQRAVNALQALPGVDKALAGLPSPLLPDLLTLDQALQAVHTPMSEAHRDLARKSLAYHELVFLQLRLQQRRQRFLATNEGKQTCHRVSDLSMCDAAKSVLPFKLTADQQRVLEEVLKDMDKPMPMFRLMQGDVGSGKTVVALLAMLAAAGTGSQALLLAPTEILAQQHHQTITTLVNKLPKKVKQQLLGAKGEAPALLSGAAKGSERTSILKGLQSGSIRLLISTHAAFWTEGWARLGLVVIDEQHKFGLAQKQKLLRLCPSVHPHVLSMSATPIPRTMALAMYGDMEVSIIQGRPPGRQIVATRTLVDDDEGHAYMVSEVVREIDSGGRAFIVYPGKGTYVEGSDDEDEEEGSTTKKKKKVSKKGKTKVAKSAAKKVKASSKVKGGKGKKKADSSDVEEDEFIEALASLDEVEEEAIKMASADYERMVAEKVFGKHKCVLLHGGMSPSEKIAAIGQHRSGSHPIMICTSVVEVGVDVADASIMVVQQADRFGLAQLHQMRGRVGRGTRASQCLLLTANNNQQAQQRLQTLETCHDGLEIAERDLVFRGAGSLFSTTAKQSGTPDCSALCSSELFKDPLLVQAARDSALAAFKQGLDPVMSAAVDAFAKHSGWKQEEVEELGGAH